MAVQKKWQFKNRQKSDFLIGGVNSQKEIFGKIFKIYKPAA